MGRNGGGETETPYVGAPRRVDVELFIVHPTMAPADISTALSLEANFAHCVGDQKRTRTGVLLEGRYRDTRWRHSVRHELEHQWFADKVSLLADRLWPHKDFLRQLRATGGHASIVVQFLGDGYLGDALPLDTLSKLVELQLDLGIECYAAPQS